MRSCRILGLIVLLPLVFVAVNPDVVSARSAALSLDLLLTPQEQAARLWGLAGPEIARKLYPSAAEAIKPKPMPYYQRDYRPQWLGASAYQSGRSWRRK